MADFNITVRVDPRPATQGNQRVRRELHRTSQAADRLRRSLLLTFGRAAFGAAVFGSVRTLAAFEQAMSTVRAVSQATTDQLALLREEAKRLGVTTRFSATQAAEGMIFLARAGFDANEVFKAVGPTLTLAQAGALDLGRAADIASNILQGFSLNAAEAVRVVDVLALAANSSNTNVEQLGKAMSFVAPAARAVGVEIEETAAAISALSNAGIQGARAGTGLRSILIRLEKAGGSLSVQANGLTEVLELLASRNITLSEAAQLVGVRQASALLVLVDSIDTVKALTGEYENAAGAAAEIARIMDDNLNGAILSVKSAIEGLVIELGDAGATGALTSAFRSIAEGIRFLAKNVEIVVSVFETLAIVLVVGLVRKAIPAVIAAFNRMTVAIAANPLGALITALTVSIALLAGFADQILLVAETGVTLEDVFVATFQDIKLGLADFIESFDGGFGLVDAKGLLTAESIGQAFVDLLRSAAMVADGIIATFAGAYQAILATFEGLPSAFQNFFERLFNSLIREAERGIQGLVDTLNPILEFFELGAIGNVNLGRVKQTAVEAGRTTLEGFVEGFNANDDAITSVLDGAITRIGNAAADRASRRAEEEAIREATLKALRAQAAGTPGGTTDPTRGGGGIGDLLSDDDGGKGFDRAAIVAEELRQLNQEIELIGAVGVERDILRGKLDLEANIRNELRQANEDMSVEELNRLSRLTAAEGEAVEAAIRRADALQREQDVLEDLRGPSREYEANLAAINRLLDRGAISQREFAERARDLRIEMLSGSIDMADQFEAGLLRIDKSFQNTSDLALQGIQNAMTGAEDAIVDFVKTGKLEFGDLVDSILNDLIRLAVRQSITGPLSGALFGGGGGGGAGILGGLFSGGGGGGGGGGLLGGLTSLLGFASGGSFGVNGFGGIDNNILSINGSPVARVSRGETVSVDGMGGGNGGGGGRPITIQFNITTPDANSFKKSQGQIMAQAQAAIRRADQRNN